MNVLMKSVMLSAAILCAAGFAVAQEATPDRVNVPLTDPSRPVMLKIGLLSGSITVKGSATKEVVVEARTRATDSDDEERSDHPRGLRLIPNRSSGLTVEEDDNTVNVSTGMRGGSHTTDLTIKVPINTSMKLSTVNDGNIAVDNVNGDLEVNNTNGNVSLTNISGSAVAHALNGDLVVTFVKVNPQKSMSFSSLNGKIDVTLPSDIKATMTMKSDMGEVYSDFDMKVQTTAPTVEENTRGKKGKFRIAIDKGMSGTVNGGGQDIQFTNFNGDIYIRKAK
jgi:DUF4097 and DUF4098 domain-containing protein YvlB